MDNKATILIVEDNERINRLFYKQLTAAGYQCISAFSIKEAVQVVEKSGAPALIILDLELSDGYGTEVLDYLNANHIGGVKIIVVSANAFSSTIPMKNYTVDHTLLKPVSPRGLSALIKETLADTLEPSPPSKPPQQ